jgi:hypothetical protein
MYFISARDTMQDSASIHRVSLREYFSSLSDYYEYYSNTSFHSSIDVNIPRTFLRYNYLVL